MLKEFRIQFDFFLYAIYHSLWITFDPQPNLREVVQRARPSYNPRGTCPRWAVSPAAPRWTKIRSQQFQAHRILGGKVFLRAHAHFVVALKCLNV
jgi:hypothetical protein